MNANMRFKQPKYALKTPKYALKNFNISTSNYKTAYNCLSFYKYKPF